jgi:hypothetical protein
MSKIKNNISFRFNRMDENENTVFEYLKRLKDNVKHLFGTLYIRSSSSSERFRNNNNNNR